MKFQPAVMNGPANLLIPASIGLFCFLMMMGLRPLNPADVSWFMPGDPAQDWLGWMFFRNSPWTFPLGVNEGWGLDYVTSIYFTDSFPLASLLLKPFSRWLPFWCQFIGPLMCVFFMLQTICAWKIMERYIGDRIALSLCSTMFLFSLPMLNRLNGHYTLVAHFFILWAIYLFLSSRRCPHCLQWCVLLNISLLTHFYIFAMCIAFWLASICNFWIGNRSAGFLLKESLVLLAVLLVAWITGLFVHSGTAGLSEGFGYFRMNAWAMADANGWSYFFRDLPDRDGEYEGFNFAGTGYFLLIAWTIPLIIKNFGNFKKTARKYWLLEILLCCFFLFALSNNVGIGKAVFHIPLPDGLSTFLNNFRSSGRFVWPVNYCLLIFLLVTMFRGYDKRLLYWLLSLAVVIQITDSSSQWRKFRQQDNNFIETVDQGLKDELWSRIPEKYFRIKHLPWKSYSPDYLTFGVYSLKNNMKNDLVYYNRDFGKLNEAAKKDYANIAENCAFDHDTLYIVNETDFEMLKKKCGDGKTVFRAVDGYHLILPNYLDILQPGGQNTF